MIEWRNLVRGIMMGITDLIPGVSGGTMALALGIYQRLISAINGLLSRDWKRSVGFLFPLGIGIVFALLLFSGLIEWLLHHFPEPTYFFFLGLILGIIPFLLKDIDFRRNFKVNHYILLLVSAVLVALTVFVREDKLGAVMSELTLWEFVFLFFSGWLASSAMILPGISGSFILLLLGVYPTVINALSSLNLGVIMVVGMGVLFGILITSKLISYLLMHFIVGTYSVIIGMVIGSLIVIFPGFHQNIMIMIICVFTVMIGYGCSMLLERVNKKSKG